MRLIVITGFILLSQFTGQAQGKVDSSKVICFYSPASSFPGGKEALDKFIQKNFKWKQSRKTVEGKVFVSFIVNLDGTTSDLRIAKGLCDSCDEEALRIMKLMPKWIPATIEGKKYRTKMILPFTFSL